MALFGSKKRKEQEAALLATEDYVFRIENICYTKNNIVSLGGRMIKGCVCVGDAFLFDGVEYQIVGLARGTEPNYEIAQNLYCGLLIRYKTTGMFKTIFKLGAVKIIKKTNKPQPNIQYAAQPQKTIADVFTCNVCGKEYPIKYKHNNMCSNCAQAIHEHKAQQAEHLNANDYNSTPPVTFNGTNIHINTKSFFQWMAANFTSPQYTLNGILPLTNKEPVISLYEDGVKTREYVLQTENAEDFTGKYFLISVRMGIQGTPSVPVAQIDGFVSDSPEERAMTFDDIGYRMEGHFLACGGAPGKQRYEMIRGQDLLVKGLKYPGYTTPSNVRLIGICPDCGKSFCFRGYAFYMTQSDIAYSDDGLDCCEIQAHNINKETWVYETEGKVFRYYNSFNCPHCGSPYIDYKKHPQNKVFGVSGCVLLGKKHYQFKETVVSEEYPAISNIACMKPIILENGKPQDILSQQIESAKAKLASYFSQEIVEIASREFNAFCRIEGLCITAETDFGRRMTLAQASDENDLLFKVIKEIANTCAQKYEQIYRSENAKDWRYIRSKVVDGHWVYTENIGYRYNTIEDTRKVWFEKHIGAMAFIFSIDSVRSLISEYTNLMNSWFDDNHWTFNCERMEFIEISSSKERDTNNNVHPHPNEILK